MNNQKLKIEIEPNELIQGDNQIVIVVQNNLEVVIKSLTVRVIPGNNLFLSSVSSILFPDIHPGKMCQGEIQINTPACGIATLQLRCSWKQNQKFHNDDPNFWLKVIETSTSRKNTKSSGYSPSYLRNYYINSLPLWRKLLQTKQKHYQHLRLQSAEWGELDVPFRIVNQIEKLKAEIASLSKQIKEGEEYLTFSG